MTIRDGSAESVARDVIVRFHEIALKGRNRPAFIGQLANNLRRATVGLGVERVWPERLSVRLALEPGTRWEPVSDRIAKVFGVAKFALATRTALDYAGVAAAVSDEARRRRFQTFRITANRDDKRFPMTSQELNIRLGDLVREQSGARVDLSHAELNIHVQMLARDALVYAQEYAGPGGLPVGTAGRVTVLMSGGIDSPVATWRMMRRGCKASLVHFHSFPLVEGRSREKARELAERLNAWQFDTRLYLVPFAEVQRQVILSVPGPLRVIAYRRLMVRIAEAIAKREGSHALVTGESVGQVGSQTLRNMATVDEVAEMPIFRPLIGMDKQEIIQQAQAIGTFEASILPDEDCCTLFVPRSPSTAVRPEQIAPYEAELDVPALVSESAANAEIVDYHMPAAPNTR